MLAVKDDDTTIKLVDFGFAVRCDDVSQVTKNCGTLIYAAPEVIENKPHGDDLHICCENRIPYF